MQILRFMLPMLAGNIIQQFYNTADSVIVGNYIGDLALSAVGSAGPVLNLLIVLLVGISTGAGVVAAQVHGAGQRDELAGVIANCLKLTAAAALLVMGASVFLIHPMLRLMGTPELILPWCEEYLRLLLLGRPILRLFTDTEEVQMLGMEMLRILAMGYVCFFLTQCFCGAMSGSGHTTATMKVSVAATFLVRLPAAWLFVALTRSPAAPQGNPEALYVSQLLAWLFGTVYAYYLYRTKNKPVGTELRVAKMRMKRGGSRYDRTGQCPSGL